jgi:hypothetical protein
MIEFFVNTNDARREATKILSNIVLSVVTAADITNIRASHILCCRKSSFGENIERLPRNSRDIIIDAIVTNVRLVLIRFALLNSSLKKRMSALLYPKRLIVEISEIAEISVVAIPTWCGVYK